MNELLKLPKEKRPEFVTMVDIDEVVMEACAEHMPNVCGPYLQKNYWNGPNYRIIAGCAIQFMKDCQVSILLPTYSKNRYYPIPSKLLMISGTHTYSLIQLHTDKKQCRLFYSVYTFFNSCRLQSINFLNQYLYTSKKLFVYRNKARSSTTFLEI